MSTGIVLESICRILAGMCLIGALVTAAAAVVLLIREDLTDRVRDEIKSKYSHRLGLLVFFAVCVWLLVIGQNVSAAEVVIETEEEVAAAGEMADAGEAAVAGEVAVTGKTEDARETADDGEVAGVGMTDVEMAQLEEPTGVEEPSGTEQPSEPQEPTGPEEPSEPQGPDEPSEPQGPDKPSEPQGPDEPSEPQESEEPSEPQEPEEPSEPQKPDGLQDLQAPAVRIEMTEEVNRDEKGTVYCRADNAGIRILMEENREEDTGIARYKIVIADCEGKEFCREWENTEEPDPEQQGLPGSTEVLIETQVIAAMADGLITVHAEAEDTAGNLGESGFSYILDQTAPVGEIFYESTANGYLYEEESGAEVFWNADVEVSLRVRDSCAGQEVPVDEDAYGFLIWMPEESEQPTEVEPSGETPDSAETGQQPAEEPSTQTQNGRPVEQISDSAETGQPADGPVGEEPDTREDSQVLIGTYLLDSDAQVRFGAYGRDRAGNPMTVREVIGTGAAVIRSEAIDGPMKIEHHITIGEDISGQIDPEHCLPRAKIVRDTTSPTLTTAISRPIGNPAAIDERNGIIYYGRNGNQYIDGIPAINASFTVSDRNIDESRIVTLLAYADVPDGGNCEEVMPESVEEVTPDRVGLLETEKLNADTGQETGSAEDEPQQAEGTGQETGGTGNEGQQTDDTCEPASDDETKSLKFSLVRYPGRDGTPDGVYRFGIKGTDKAGNPLRLEGGRDEAAPSDGDPDAPPTAPSNGNPNAPQTAFSDSNPNAPSDRKEEEDELNGVVCADAGIGMFLTGRKVVDTVAPSGEVQIENNDGSVYYHIKEHGRTWSTSRDGFMPYRREQEAVIRYIGDDTSPVSVSCRIRSTSGGNNEAAPDGSAYSIPCRPQTHISGEQTFRIEGVVFRDRAGNESSVLTRTVNIYLDTRPPKADIDAPSAYINAVSASANSNVDGRPMYASGITLEIRAVDPHTESGASGLYEVRYEIEIAGKIVRSTTLFRGDEPSSEWESEKEPQYEYSGRIEIPSGGQWESDDIVVRVTAEDNAGNRSAESEGSFFRFGIDTTGPEVTVSYDNNEVRNGLYFDKERVARISVRERNFDTGMISISAPGAQIGMWSLRQSARSTDNLRQSARGTDNLRQREGGTDNGGTESETVGSGDSHGSSTDGIDTWTMEVRFPADGIYTLDVSGMDAAGNPASVRYEGEAVRAFVVDGTPPHIEVTWNNMDVRNGKYYNRERIATVRITDLSFSEDRVTVLPASTGFHEVTEEEGSGAGSATWATRSATRVARFADRDGQAGTSGWASPTAQVYEMKLPYTNEGEWTLSCACTDLAGNTAVPVTEPQFVLDFTGPKLRFDKGTVKENGAYADAITPLLRWDEENPSSAACYASWVNVTAGGKIMECRSGAYVSGSRGAGKTKLSNLPYTKEADGICVLYGTACDLAGNRTFVRRNLSVNRFGSLYDLSEDDGTLQMIAGYYTDGGAPFIVAEYNVSTLVKRQMTLYINGIAYVLTEDTDYTVEETQGRAGHKYIYRIDPSVFRQEGVYSLLLESDDAAGRHNSSPGRFMRKIDSSHSGKEEEAAYSPEWAIDRTPPTVRLTGVDIDRHRFVTDTVSFSLIPEDNMELQRMTIRIIDDNGVIYKEQKLEKDELREILDANRGGVPVEINASGKWQTLTATVTDGAGNSAEEQRYRLLVSSNLLVHLYRSGLLPAVAFLALVAVVWIRWKGKSGPT